MIVHLEPEQAKEERRRLLGDDVFVIFHDALREWQRKGFTQMASSELFLSAKAFAKMLLGLPDAMEGLEDEMEDLADEADGENDAMIISMLATAILYAACSHRLGFDAASVIRAIYIRWNDHPLFFPFLDEGAKKEQARWLEGKKVRLLTYELNEINNEKPDLKQAREVVRILVDNCENLTGDAIEKILVPLMSTNELYNHAFDAEVDRLKKKLGLKTHSEINIEEFVVNKNVENEINKIEKGGIGIQKNN